MYGCVCARVRMCASAVAYPTEAVAHSWVTRVSEHVNVPREAAWHVRRHAMASDWFAMILEIYDGNNEKEVSNTSRSHDDTHVSCHTTITGVLTVFRDT